MARDEAREGLPLGRSRGRRVQTGLWVPVSLRRIAFTLTASVGRPLGTVGRGRTPRAILLRLYVLHFGPVAVQMGIGVEVGRIRKDVLTGAVTPRMPVLIGQLYPVA